MLFDKSSPDYEYDSLDGQNTYRPSKWRTWLQKATAFWREAVIILLCIICTALLVRRPLPPSNNQNTPGVDQGYRLTSDDSRWRPFEWHTETYSSEDPANERAVDAAWDAIMPSHGIVAVSHEWAAEHSLPSTLSLPSDSSKGVYVIDAYHQIHCLTIVRQTLMQLSRGEEPSMPVDHSRHCFDSLLQYIMCGSTGDTLLYVLGNNRTGADQLRRCVDWSSRRDWATANSACYKDGDHSMTMAEHFGHCEDLDDGIRGLDW